MLVFHDEWHLTGSAIDWVLLVGEQPFLFQGVRIDERYTHTIGESPYHILAIHVYLLDFRNGLVRVLYAYQLRLEGTRIIYDGTEVGGYQKLESCVFQLVDSGYAGWHWNHGNMVSCLIEYGNPSIRSGEIDGVAHLTEPFERNRSTEFGAIDDGSFVGEYPLTPFFVGCDKPDFAAWKMLAIHLDELWVVLVKLFLAESKAKLVVGGGNPSAVMVDRINLIHV